MGKYLPLCDAYISSIKQRITEMNIDEVKSNQASSQSIHLIDVRDADEWKKGHLPNAYHLPRSKLEFQIEKYLPKVDMPVILYCGGGGRSALAANTLLQMGYKNVISMAGGYRAWIEANFPTVAADEE